jgi:hypothetical protein
MSKLAFVAAVISLISVAACEPADEITPPLAPGARDLTKLEDFLIVRYDAKRVILGSPQTCTAANQMTRDGYTFTVSTVSGKVFTGVGCHTNNSPNWEVWLDAGPILIENSISPVPRPAPVAAPAPVAPAPAAPAA